MAVGVDGCKQVRSILDAVVRESGKRMVESGLIDGGTGLDEV